jgi:hypothetical protein
LAPHRPSLLPSRANGIGIPFLDPVIECHRPAAPTCSAHEARLPTFHVTLGRRVRPRPDGAYSRSVHRAGTPMHILRTKEMERRNTSRLLYCPSTGLWWHATCRTVNFVPISPHTPNVAMLSFTKSRFSKHLVLGCRITMPGFLDRANRPCVQGTGHEGCYRRLTVGCKFPSKVKVP